MSPEALAARHPRLYHQTAPAAWPLIQKHGLLPPAVLLRRAGLSEERIARLTQARRPEGVRVETDFGPEKGVVEINDNIPLSHAALERCLDDGLSPAAWCALLAERVFFWADDAPLARLRNARSNRARDRLTLVIDTPSFARAHGDRIELSPINSGSTIRKPARRGLSTFAPMRDFESYEAWARLRRDRGERKGLDRVKEVVVPGVLADIADHVVEVRR